MNQKSFYANLARDGGAKIVHIASCVSAALFMGSFPAKSIHCVDYSSRLHSISSELQIMQSGQPTYYGSVGTELDPIVTTKKGCLFYTK